MKKKLISIILIIIVCSCYLSDIVLASSDNAIYVYNTSNNMNMETNLLSMVESEPSQSAEIPTSFDLRDKINITVENQGDTDLCWTFASLGALRTHIALKKSQETNKKETTPNLSEAHLAYLTCTNSGKEGFTRTSWEDGGGIPDAIKYFENGDGPVLEEKCKFENISNFNVNELDAINPDYYVHEIVKFPAVKKSIENGNIKILKKDLGEAEYSEINTDELNEFRKEIKEHIMEYGGIYAAIRKEIVQVMRFNLKIMELI